MTKAAEVRESTDASLRVERDQADAAVESRLERVEAKTDQATEESRVATDLATEAARNEVDQRGDTRTSKEKGAVKASRAQEDVEVERKREVADAATRLERGERKRYMEAFLATERGRTDEDLVEERGLADTLVVSRDEFLANVSHDLRTLLGGLSLTAGLLDKVAPGGEAGGQIRKLATVTGRYVARMDRLLNDLLDVSSIEAGKLRVVRERVAVARLVEETVAAFAPVAKAKGVTLQSVVAEDLGDASLDGDRLLQVLANLVSNAIKFTPEGGQVSVAAVVSDREIHFTVQDSGVGIPADQLGKIFERFRQLSRTRLGLGLGLHISKCLVEAHGGRTWAESVVGAGSTLHVVLPREAP
jgi:signal transduction histidine kinase